MKYTFCTEKVFLESGLSSPVSVAEQSRSVETPPGLPSRLERSTVKRALLPEERETTRTSGLGGVSGQRRLRPRLRFRVEDVNLRSFALHEEGVPHLQILLSAPRENMCSKNRK